MSINKSVWLVYFCYEDNVILDSVCLSPFRAEQRKQEIQKEKDLLLAEYFLKYMSDYYEDRKDIYKFPYVKSRNEIADRVYHYEDLKEGVLQIHTIKIEEKEILD